MNLAVDSENEDRIRQEGGITPIVNILKSFPATDPTPQKLTVLLHTLRLMINLTFNDLNCEVIIKEDGCEFIKKLIDLFSSRLHDTQPDDQVVMILILLFRVLSGLIKTVKIDEEEYSTIANAENAKLLKELMILKKSEERQRGYLLDVMWMIGEKGKEKELKEDSSAEVFLKEFWDDATTEEVILLGRSAKLPFVQQKCGDCIALAEDMLEGMSDKIEAINKKIDGESSGIKD
eukprot:TRINITY_DN8829_c0_g1_i1.p1 TRINITY_DN8829_c0_g1~~TRINITY_DN8829_c0_g1_i1.p1  ORF type:complete len:234 (-),score=62.55 TRINITY_DN8829_c0_g1_i1:56-757(-)